MNLAIRLLTLMTTMDFQLIGTIRINQEKERKARKENSVFQKAIPRAERIKNPEKPNDQNPSHYGESSSSNNGPPKAIFFASDQFLAFQDLADSSS